MGRVRLVCVHTLSLGFKEHLSFMVRLHVSEYAFAYQFPSYTFYWGNLMVLWLDSGKVITTGMLLSSRQIRRGKRLLSSHWKVMRYVTLSQIKILLFDYSVQFFTSAVTADLPSFFFLPFSPIRLLLPLQTQIFLQPTQFVLALPLTSQSFIMR